MSDIDFSLVINTRARVELLANCIDSVKTLAKNPEKVEYLCRCDLDDLPTINWIHEQKNPLIRLFVGLRPDNLLVSMNDLAAQARGRFIWAMNDDVQCLTKDWDEIAKARAEEFKKANGISDDILLLATSDTSVDKPAGKDYSSFFFVTKEAFDALGYFVNPVFKSLGGDSHCCRIFEALGRIVSCHEILIDHLLHSSVAAVMSPDETAARYRKLCWDAPIDPFTYPIEEDVEKLRKALR